MEVVTADAPIFPFIPLPSVYIGKKPWLVLFWMVVLCWLIASSLEDAMVIDGGVHHGGARNGVETSMSSGLKPVCFWMRILDVRHHINFTAQELT